MNTVWTFHIRENQRIILVYLKEDISVYSDMDENSEETVRNHRMHVSYIQIPRTGFMSREKQDRVAGFA